MRLLLYVELMNSPDAVAKLMLTVKQGGLSLENISINSMDGGQRLSATLTLVGREEKGEWLARKLLNFPYFHKTRLLKLSEQEAQ
ncbi:MAG: hypothetical protein QXD32_04640 [Nitrososphaerota archaeon]